MRVQRWTKWETYGDDPGESVDKLKLPLPYKNSCHRFWSNFLLQVSMRALELDGVASCFQKLFY